MRCVDKKSEGFETPLVCMTAKSYPCSRRFQRSIRAGGLDFGLSSISCMGLQLVNRAK